MKVSRMMGWGPSQGVRPTTIRKLGVIWLVLACCFQLGLSVWIARLTNCSVEHRAAGYFSIRGGDHPSYLGAMENYISEGTYYFLNGEEQKVFAGRMPHYAVPYYLFRRFMDVGHSSDAVVILQVLLFVYGCWLLANLLVEISGKRWAGFVFLGACLGSAHLAPYIVLLQPEAMSFGLLMLIAHSFWRVQKSGRWMDVLLLSISVGVLTTLKPYFVLLYPMLGLLWLWQRVPLRNLVTRGVTLSGTLIVLLFPWWVRNAGYFEDFFPFQQDTYAGYAYSDVDLSVRELLKITGDDASTFWEPGSMACAFRYAPPLPCTFQWPSRFTPGLRMKFEHLRHGYIRFQQQEDPALAAALIAEVDDVKAAYMDEFPWRSRLFHRFVLVKRFLVNSGSYHMPVHPSNPCFKPSQYVAKLAASAGYLASLAGLLLGSIVFIVRRSKMIACWLVPAYFLLLLFPIGLGAVEWRYFMTAFPFDLGVLVLLIADRSWMKAAPTGNSSSQRV